jgi:uncharacterized protein (DUF2147 family)
MALMLAVGAAAIGSVATDVALAGDTYHVDVGGRTIRIDQPRNCRSADCVTVSVPGYYEGRPETRRARKARRERLAKEKNEAKLKDQSRQLDAAQPTVERKSDLSARDAQKPNSSAKTAATVAATGAATTAAVSTTRALEAKPLTASPLGVWLTEETNSKVRIEACGALLCGYAIDPKSGDKADKVLIDMAASGPKWTGRIFDPGNGNNFDSTISLISDDALRVQGCPANATFCGTQTWTRVN